MKVQTPRIRNVCQAAQGMLNVLAAVLICVASAGCETISTMATPKPMPKPSQFNLITLDPGHFHSALVQKFMYPGVDRVVHIYAPGTPGTEAEGDLAEHVKRIQGFNGRAEKPTDWELQVHTGPDYLEHMLAEKPGNVVVLAGNNAKKTDYILKSVQAGLNVLADKPMAINPAGFEKLKEAFATAAANHVLLYDIMTERFEITTALQRELSQQPALFGELVKGTREEPAITKESVHHFSKMVSGSPLKRPMWFFDVRQEGEGIVDVTTHLVDLVQWEAFPEMVVSPSDVKMLAARRWATAVTREQFQKTTGGTNFPAYLNQDVKDGVLQVYSNGEFTYQLRGVFAKVSVTWNYEAPAGTGDTHYSMMRGTRARLIIRQGAEQAFKPVLYVEKADATDDPSFFARLRGAITVVQRKYPGVDVKRDGANWVVTVPEKYNIGHESHFGQVTENYLKYLRAGKLPDWEVPNMITKYYTIMQAYEMSR